MQFVPAVAPLVPAFEAAATQLLADAVAIDSAVSSAYEVRFDGAALKAREVTAEIEILRRDVGTAKENASFGSVDVRPRLESLASKFGCRFCGQRCCERAVLESP